MLTKHKVRLFGLISYKPTLGGYGEEIDWQPHKFYNKCAKYLLEMIGSYLSQVDTKLVEPRIVFEDRNHDFDAMRRYLMKVKENPHYQQSLGLSAINPFGLVTRKKGEEPLLKLSDLVAHSVYSCVNKTADNFGIVEPRYLYELSSRFAANANGVVLGTGLKVIHSLKDLELDDSVEQGIERLRAHPLPKKRSA